MRLDGEVKHRPAGTENTEMPTGLIEVYVREIEVLGAAAELPVPVFGDQHYPEETRLKYRFLDLRREKLHANIMLRGRIIDSLRTRMKQEGFFEFQTPILTASSPEGARDFLVPSRLHPGKFYALPQAPQQFKQLLMVAGFDRYFQIAPCFRDEDARADRSPGEFYQLDVEMSFVTQEDVFAAIEPVLHGRVRGIRERQAGDAEPFRASPISEAMLKYGSDKPDLRNPLVIADVSDDIRARRREFKAFKGKTVRAIPAPGAGAQPRSFFDKLNDWARSEGAPGLGYVDLRGGTRRARRQGADRQIHPRRGAGRHRRQGRRQGRRRGVLLRRRGDARRETRGRGARPHRHGTGALQDRRVRILLDRRFPDVRMERGRQEDRLLAQSLLHAAGRARRARHHGSAGHSRLAIRHRLQWRGAVLRARSETTVPTSCGSAFEIAGYDEDVLIERFGGMYRAFQYGAPPHGGIAPGVDRIVMLLAGEENLREVTLFPLNQRAEDPLMGAPSPATTKQLRELHIRLNLPEKS